MSFCVSYSKCQTTPFEDWQARGSILDAVFRYSAHFNLDIVVVCFMPGYKFGYIEVYESVSSFTVCFEMSFDKKRNTVNIERLLCDNDEALKDVSKYISFMGLFFGPEWTVAPIPTMQPLGDDCLDLAARCHRLYGPWFRVVGIYPMEREAAATTIQKIFRGWRTRMEHTFNPHTCYGKFLILRDFAKAI